MRFTFFFLKFGKPTQFAVMFFGCIFFKKIIISNCIAHVFIVYVLVFVVVFCKKLRKKGAPYFREKFFVYFLNLAGLYFNNSKN